MSQCIVPNWNLKHQRQQQVEEEEGEEEAEQGNRSSHVLPNPNNIHHLVPMSNYEVAELTWENGQLAMHGLSGLLPTTAPTKPTYRSSDTLESIVHQATFRDNQKQNFDFLQLHDQTTPANRSSIAASSGGNCGGESSCRLPVAVEAALLKKRARSDSDQCGKYVSCGGIQEDGAADRSAGATASATFYRDNDATMVTSASHESPRRMKTKTTDGDSSCHDGSENRDEDRETRGETGRSQSTRISRAAAVHNLSERKRRDRINQKMKTLQKLVPNANKTDKASMLDEVIEYLKQLQAQVQMMSSMRSNMPQMMMMMMPPGMQQHLQMSLLARMGMGMGVGLGMGMGMGQPLLDINAAAAAVAAMAHRNASQLHHPSPPAVTAHPTSAFLPPVPFVAPPMIPPHAAAQADPNASSNALAPLPDPSCAILAQSMNMELYSKMAALYQQQMNRKTQSAASSPSPSKNVQED